jgi:hypothetical protein
MAILILKVQIRMKSWSFYYVVESFVKHGLKTLFKTSLRPTVGRNSIPFLNREMNVTNVNYFFGSFLSGV